MRHIKHFFSKIKEFISKNYWLQPVLLVAIVFAVVFSITGISDLFSTVKGWFTPNADTCKLCTSYKTSQYDVFDTAINAATDEQEPVFIVITQDNCGSCSTLYPLLNRFLDANKDITVYQLKIEYDSQGKIRFDSINSKAKYDALAQALYDVALGNGEDPSNLQSAMLHGIEFNFATPSLLVYANNSPVVFNNILRYKIGTFTSNELLRLNDFFTKKTNGFFTLDY